MALLYQLAMQIADNIDCYVHEIADRPLITSEEAMMVCYKTAGAFFALIADGVPIEDLIEGEYIGY